MREISDRVGRYARPQNLLGNLIRRSAFVFLKRGVARPIKLKINLPTAGIFDRARVRACFLIKTALIKCNAPIKIFDFAYGLKKLRFF